MPKRQRNALRGEKQWHLEKTSTEAPAWIGLDSCPRQVFIYLDPILIYISLWIECLFEIRKIAVCFLLLLLPGDYRVTDEAPRGPNNCMFWVMIEAEGEVMRL